MLKGFSWTVQYEDVKSVLLSRHLYEQEGFDVAVYTVS